MNYKTAMYALTTNFITLPIQNVSSEIIGFIPYFKTMTNYEAISYVHFSELKQNQRTYKVITAVQ